MNYSELQRLRSLTNALYTAGVKAYVVGGAVRNELLELPVKDIDIAVADTPAELLSLLPDSAHLVDSAQAYPVISFLGFEIASFRKDGRNRQDASGIELGATMEEDAQRRDLTINALYLRLGDYLSLQEYRDKGYTQIMDEGDVIDPTGYGLKDLNAGILRLIGDPFERLEEDPLRALRAYRFYTQFSEFRFELGTELAVKSMLMKIRMKQ